MSSDLNEAKQRLVEKLGPHYEIYIQLLGKWFRGLISKEEFDRSAKQLIEENFVLEHNKFWLGFFHHCANNTSSTSVIGSQSHTNSFQLNQNGACYEQNQHYIEYDHNHHGACDDYLSSNSQTPSPSNFVPNAGSQKSLSNKILTQMKIIVIAWEMGLDSADDDVSVYINLALRYFLKNIITELITTKTAYRLRENKFKYAIGVKPINPYLNNSLKIYSSNFEYDPYQIESSKMNSSLVDTYAYNDSLFPSRLYEAQALYEYACSTTSPVAGLNGPNTNGDPEYRNTKRLKMMDDMPLAQSDTVQNGDKGLKLSDMIDVEANVNFKDDLKKDKTELGHCEKVKVSERRLTLSHLLIAFLSNKSIMPRNLYSITLERIFTKLSY